MYYDWWCRWAKLNLISGLFFCFPKNVNEMCLFINLSYVGGFLCVICLRMTRVYDALFPFSCLDESQKIYLSQFICRFLQQSAYSVNDLRNFCTEWKWNTADILINWENYKHYEVLRKSLINSTGISGFMTYVTWGLPNSYTHRK